jgi:hypothetical protein
MFKAHFKLVLTFEFVNKSKQESHRIEQTMEDSGRELDKALN